MKWDADVTVASCYRKIYISLIYISFNHRLKTEILNFKMMLALISNFNLKDSIRYIDTDSFWTFKFIASREDTKIERNFSEKQ